MSQILELNKQHSTEQEAHARVKKEPGSLGVVQDRLLDLAADGSMTTEKVRE